ncbi:hypothetical protein [Pseudomonas sp. CBZ-4]|uniref:hypothetical protein n=1 Tax=Pseudomonas sp. CBZ-4 TaxID=1163065 RepID=UPI0003820B38|nr:hypothetical protein [Pseudomonas sp. CBZ-4]
MQIVNDLFSQTGRSVEHNRATPEQSADRTDVSFFASMLDGSRPMHTVSDRPEVSLLLTEASKHLSNSRDGFAKLIRSTKKGIDVEAIGTYPRELNNAQLTSQLMVKCLAKTTQCVDKIGNMQS